MRKNEMRPAATRRSILKSGAGAAALGTLGMPFVLRRARAQGDFDWKRFSGQKIEVLLAKGPRGDLLQKYEPEFTELTGIEVGSEQVPEQQQRQKAVIEFTSGATSFDALMLALHVQKRLVAKGRWLVDLRKWLDDPAMTAPDLSRVAEISSLTNLTVTWAMLPLTSASTMSALLMPTKLCSISSPRASRSPTAATKPSNTSRLRRSRSSLRLPSANAVTIIS